MPAQLSGDPVGHDLAAMNFGGLPQIVALFAQAQTH
jgi:hypothetical protein